MATSDNNNVLMEISELSDNNTFAEATGKHTQMSSPRLSLLKIIPWCLLCIATTSFIISLVWFGIGPQIPTYQYTATPRYSCPTNNLTSLANYTLASCFTDRFGSCDDPLSLWIWATVWSCGYIVLVTVSIFYCFPRFIPLLYKVDNMNFHLAVAFWPLFIIVMVNLIVGKGMCGPIYGNYEICQVQIPVMDLPNIIPLIENCVGIDLQNFMLKVPFQFTDTPYYILASYHHWQEIFTILFFFGVAMAGIGIGVYYKVNGCNTH